MPSYSSLWQIFLVIYSSVRTETSFFLSFNSSTTAAHRLKTYLSNKLFNCSKMSLLTSMAQEIFPLRRSERRATQSRTFKRLFLLPEPGKGRRGRPLKVKTGLPGRPRKLPRNTQECKKPNGCLDLYTHPDHPHKIIYLNDLPPLFVQIESLDPAPDCEFHNTFVLICCQF